MVDERLEELEGLGREMNFLATAQELPRIGIEREIAKTESHNAALRKTKKTGMTFQRLVTNGH
jgi:hypothetical protein